MSWISDWKRKDRNTIPKLNKVTAPDTTVWCLSFLHEHQQDGRQNLCPRIFLNMNLSIQSAICRKGKVMSILVKKQKKTAVKDAKKIPQPSKKISKPSPKQKNPSGSFRAAKASKEHEALLNSIPYAGVYEEKGMIVTKPALPNGKPSYSIEFRIGDVKPEDLIAADSYSIHRALSDLLDGFPDTVSYQFFVLNNRTASDDFLEKARCPKTGDPALDQGVDVLNSVIEENAPLGHNNMSKTKYIVFALEADNADRALEIFDEIEKRAEDLFYNFCGLSIQRLTCAERLSQIYEIYNVGGDGFGARAGMNPASFDLDTLRRMHMNTKELVIPRQLKEEKNHVLMNETVYCRTFFINNFPSYLSDNLIADLTSVSSTMVYSALYEPLSVDYGFDLARETVADNMVIQNRHEKRTLADRKSGRVTKEAQMIQKNEDAYFSKSALDVLTDSKAAGTKVFMCSFLITLFADNEHDLDRDTKLLLVSAMKFAFQLKSMDCAQRLALSSILPLGRCYVDVKRVFPVSKLCALNPLDTQAALRENGLFYGINGVNDNLVLLNRKNSVKPSGLITGIRHAGKTFEVKREAFNNLISTDDIAVIIAGNKEDIHYAKWTSNLGGEVIREASFDPMFTTADYGVVTDGDALKADFFAALFALSLQYHDAGHTNDEATILPRLQKESKDLAAMHFSSLDEVKDYMSTHKMDADFKFPLVLRALGKMDYRFVTSKKKMKGGRLLYFSVNSPMSMLIALERIWNLAIMQKKRNRSMWVYLDSVDEILRTEEGTRYLKHLLELSNIMQNPLTIVIQNSALFGRGEDMYSLQSLFGEIGYYKFLNQGPVERTMYANALNIPNSLLSYITNVAVGSGLIISQSSNVPFTDNAKDIASDPKPMLRFFDPEIHS